MLSRSTAVLCCAALCCAALCCVASAAAEARGVRKLEEVFAWKQLTYNIEGNAVTANRFGAPVQSEGDSGWIFPEEEGSEPAESAPSGDAKFFVQYDNIPMGVDRWKDKLFISVPRRREGIPSTLNYLSLTEDCDTKSPGLRPYPDLASNSLAVKDALVNVYRTRVDACDRLWVMDTGILEIPGANRKIHNPAIVVIDLNTDKVIHRYELRDGDDYLLNDPTGFASITVDVTKTTCDNAYAYLTDLLNYGLVVYSLKENDSWRLTHNYFFLDPEQGDFNVAGINFQWSDGIFSVALGPTQSDGFRTAYFHAMASWKERSVSTAVLRNRTLATRDFHGTDFKTVGERGPNTQTTIHGVHGPTQVMFLAQVASSALTCWNTKKPLNMKNIGIVAQDDKKFLYPSDLKIDSQDYIWIMSNKLPLWIYRTLDTNEVNFRVYKVSVQDAIAGTVCAS